MNYYNDIDPFAAAWLRELITRQLIPYGYVDERSITDVTPGDLEGFTQCHFFAGIGGWSLALQLARVPASTRIWTGSPPCQPFSVAGQSLGFDDERHLAPVLLRLVRECKPQYFFGEQVAAAIGKHWLDFVFLNLEEQGYTCGAAVLPACSVGAPHKRDRLFFGAQRLGNSDMFEYHAQHYETVGGPEPALQGETRKGDGETPSNAGAYDIVADTGRGNDTSQKETADNERAKTDRPADQSGGCGAPLDKLANTDHTRPQGRGGVPERADKQPAGASGVAGELADTTQCGRRKECAHSGRSISGDSPEGWTTGCGPGGSDSSTNPHKSFWSDADWLGCRDGKFRPVEARPQQVVDGISGGMGCSGDPSFRKAYEEIGFPLGRDIPARVTRLRGYGNAIVPQVAAEFIGAFFNALSD